MTIGLYICRRKNYKKLVLLCFYRVNVCIKITVLTNSREVIIKHASKRAF
jgi:hypothetical protein